MRKNDIVLSLYDALNKAQEIMVDELREYGIDMNGEGTPNFERAKSIAMIIREVMDDLESKED